MGFKHADGWGCESIQIYVTLSRTWDVPHLTDKEVSEFKSSWKRSKVKTVVAHVPFLVNLASTDSALRKKSIFRLITEIDRADRFGVAYLVLHPGSNPNKKDGMDLIVDGLNASLNSLHNPRVKILLETVAGQGNTIGSRFEELAYLIGRVDKSEHLGACFDTCHVFAAGYDISGYNGYKSILKKFDEIIGLDKINVIHFNDSKTELGSHIDRHACIGEGLLGLQVFHAIVRDSCFTEIPKILEIPERDEKSKDNLEFLRRLRGMDGPVIEKRERQTQLT